MTVRRYLQLSMYVAFASTGTHAVLVDGVL